MTTDDPPTRSQTTDLLVSASDQSIEASDCLAAQAILESITDAFFALDREWRFTYVNSQAKRMFGLEASELLGRVIWDVYEGLRGSEFEQVYEQAMTSNLSGSFTAFYAGHNRWYEVHAYPAPKVHIGLLSRCDRKSARRASVRGQCWSFARD